MSLVMLCLQAAGDSDMPHVHVPHLCHMMCCVCASLRLAGPCRHVLATV